MARTEANLKWFMLTQQLKNEYFIGWSSFDDISALESARNGNIKPLMIRVLLRLFEKGIIVEELYGIIHQGDIRKNDLTEKETHIHIIGKFKEKVPSTLTNIANAIGIERQYIEKPKRSKYAYDNMLSYLIHIKDDDKTEHSPQEVVGIGLSEDNKEYGEKYCKPYTQIYEERKEDWIKGKAKKKTQKAKQDIDWLEEELLRGRITKGQIMLTDELYDIYARNKRRCDDAIETYGERRVYRTMEEMKNGNMRVATFFIQGKSGAGKTTFAIGLAQKIVSYAKENQLGEWKISSAAATNPVDDYKGEEVFIMDDSRGVAMGATDWLNLLDPNNISPISARYHNKIMACRVIIITSTHSPVEFFGLLKNDTKSQGMMEAMNQFLRRILANIIIFHCGDERRVCVETAYETTEYFIHPNMIDKKTGLPDTRKASYDFKTDDPWLENLSTDAAIDILAKTAIFSNQLGGQNVNPYVK